jgi:gamma-glutamylcyclotransferase (GGCT)/AIG2-like uncharacterized protein YtfP
MNQFLFIYGTLMQGQSLEGYLAGLSPRPARVQGQLFRLPAGYPALVQNNQDNWVHGELVSLPTMSRLTVLYMIEGVNKGLFSRKKIPVHLSSQTLHAWAYVMSLQKIESMRGQPLPSGDWRKVSFASPQQ